MRLLATVILVLAGLCSYAQLTTEHMVGKWVFSNGVLSSQMDERSQAMLEMALKDIFFYFKEDGTYKASDGRQDDQGAWILNIEKEKITMFSDFGDNTELHVNEIKNDEITVELRMMGQEIILARAKPTKEDERSLVLRELELVKTKTTDLRGNWSLMRMDDPAKSPERSAEINERLAGSYLRLFNDSTCSRKLSKFQERGAMGIDGRWHHYSILHKRLGAAVEHY